MIVRMLKRNRYLVVNQTVIRDERLSFRARGILMYLLSMPPNWQPRAAHISSVAPEGRDAVRKALQELDTAGYLFRHRFQDQQGRWNTHNIIFENPADRRQKKWKEEFGQGIGELGIGNSNVGDPDDAGPGDSESVAIRNSYKK